ncbi:transforming growth factor-beta-induced protein ig-h3 [Nephila pilipes]|uniref:Transforming growth factor-beta-induced protein ig-h3 n=1 Tax=Nephila pilipes TaxID=299642 RepID=A0A8X6PPJ9_NEPPI|nr:transforming growth factor-beta-induced protein ig-h3 [Nephila pilipes]
MSESRPTDHPSSHFSRRFVIGPVFCSGNHLSSAGEATPATSKEVEFSGWKPMGQTEALSTSQFVKKFSDFKVENISDPATSETRRSFLLVYPPRPNNGREQPRGDQQNQIRNFGPPVRASPTQSRYHRMMNFGASEGSNRRIPTVFQRPKFPPVANPPPLPPHAQRQKKPLPNFKPESTSQHQVQIQLLDGYIVPPSGGNGVSAVHAKDKGTQITTFPLSLNNVPEIRLLLPGDVHQQLSNIQQPPQQQNHGPKPFPEPQGQIVNDNSDRPHQEYHNLDSNIPNPTFESQRYPENDVPRNQLPPNNNNNYEQPFKPPQDIPPQQINYEHPFKPPQNIPSQQINYEQNHNIEPRRPLNTFSQPDPSAYSNGLSFPDQGHRNFQGNNNQGQNYVSEFSQNFETQNGYQTNQHLDARGPVNQVQVHSFSNVQRNRYVQNSGGDRQNEGQVFTQKSNQPGVFPAYPGQVQRGYRGESFRPLSNENYNNNQNTNQGQIKTAEGGQQILNNQYNNVQNQNLGQNAWRGKQSNRGKQNHNSISPEQQNFYNINNKNVNNQGVTHTKTNYNVQSNVNQNTGITTDRQINSIQDTLDQQKITETDIFSSTQVNNGYQTSTDQDISTQEIYNNDRNSTIQSDQVYFIPSVPSQDDVQTQIPAFDVQKTTGNKDIESDVETANVVRGDTTLIQQKESEITSDTFTTSTGIVGGQLDARSDRSGSCDCSRDCAPLQRSPSENFGTSIREIARSLNADAFFEFVGLSDEEIESMLTVDGSYTLFIPSNEAVSRLPSNLVDHWRENNPDFTMALLNHVIQDVISLDQLKQGGRLTSRANGATIFVNNYNNEAVTVNGHRIVHGDVTAPKGGLIHVIDGTLCPVADQDIINTLRTCNKYDGFLTLADVTKLLDTMQDDGPFTVFLPSNEALTKIPSDELSVLKENVTLLREFLEYHIVQGAYFSGDLKDGQYLTTLHQKQPIRVGVRVDGCYRRLVEANNSPLFKADIPTKNGVIHVIDWILRPSDLSWCEGVILP